MDKYLAIDIGATSGRHIIGYIEDGVIKLEEIYRFPNGMVEKNGHLIWDDEKLFSHILEGMKKCKELNIIPKSMGIDTWAVDYALIDENGNKLHDVIGYRDSRTNDVDKKVYEVISLDDLYARTGIQKQLFNTIYQLKTENCLDKADSMLMIPDYFNYLLTGVKLQEYTNASTTQLVSPDTKDWDYELIDKLNLPRNIFNKIILPGNEVGNLKKEIQEIVGFNCKVVLPPTHDTASAVMAVPNNEKTIYISSGTWSLMGTELMETNCSKESKEFNFTNEGGIDYRFRYLKNIMGMWMINQTRNEIGSNYSFDEICKMAEASDIESIVDASADRFLAPKSMVEEVKAACRDSGQKEPNGMGEIAKVIYMSLAKCYAKTCEEIETMTGIKYPYINVVGGGCKASYLNKLTAAYCKKDVYAGPVEATAIGNIATQMIVAKEINNLNEARDLIFKSFGVEKFKGE